MGSTLVRIFLCGLVGTILIACPQLSLLGQEKGVNGRREPAAVSVPLMGCKSDGQVGPLEAPEGGRISVTISATTARNVAYYKSAQGVGVLGPRGWYCFGTYGSGGDALVITPQPIDTTKVLSTDWDGLSGPAIQISHRFGDTMGRFDVAEIIERIFPAYKAFVTAVMKESDQLAASFTFSPYPGDTLIYKSEAVVEYKTPARTEGLGTRSWLKKNGSPIEGVAILAGPTPDLLLLSVRLPDKLTRLTSAIVLQSERDAAKF